MSSAANGASLWLACSLCLCCMLHCSALQYRTRYYLQPVDHFSFTVKDTFRQRYLVNDQYWKGNGSPIFFYTGNEGDIEWFCNNTGLMWDWATEFNAMLIFAEHRYYGTSLPYGKRSFVGLNHIGYLSSEQALADFARLIDHIRHTVSGAATSPVVAFGGSYGGMLAAWFRMKYPHVVVGSLAASAPVWLFDKLVPCELFHQIVTRDFAQSDSNCSENIRRSWSVIDSMGKTASGRAQLGSQLQLCSNLSSVDDIKVLKSWLTDTWVNLAMVDYPYPAFFLEPLPAWPVKAVCSHLSVSSLSDDDLVTHLRAAINVYYNYTGTATCFNTTQSAVSSLGDFAWSFQSCTEMVMPLCPDGVNDMFEAHPWNISQTIEDCRRMWNVTPRPHWIVEQYGGRNISASSNIVFSNGELDPWSAGGVLKSVSSSLVSVIIKNGAHHLDLRGANPHDTASVVDVRRQEKMIVDGWLKQHAAASRPLLTSTAPLEKTVVDRVELNVASHLSDSRRPSRRIPSLQDEMLVFVAMIVMFVGFLIVVSYTHHRRRRHFFDDMPLL